MSAEAAEHPFSRPRRHHFYKPGTKSAEMRRDSSPRGDVVNPGSLMDSYGPMSDKLNLGIVSHKAQL